MTPHRTKVGRPALVVHVIPSPQARGAQRAARVLVDRLNEDETVRHCLLSLFEGSPEVAVDPPLGLSLFRDVHLGECGLVLPGAKIRYRLLGKSSDCESGTCHQHGA